MNTILVGVISLLVGLQVVPNAAGAESRQFFPTNVTPDQVVEMSSSLRNKLLINYASHTNRWAAGDLLPIAIAFAMEGQDAQSEIAYTNYLHVRPDDARANRGLGIVLLAQKRLHEAIVPLGKAWRLAD